MSAYERPAVGPGAVLSTVRRALREMGPARSLQTLGRMNQQEGFDCPGCAWPDPADRGHLEFCENGAKAVAHEATRKRIGSEFFAQWSIPQLLEQSDHWLEQQGRLTVPLFRPRGADHYAPISWDAAFGRVAEELRACASPGEAVFYTSGRTSNEAAFLYQLLARLFGTNNLPDCSNLCHESSGTGLTEVIGVGKGTVGLEDFDRADAILVIGQNPGTNHPRMLTALQRAKRRGCRIVSANPLREPALVSFANPQQARGLLGLGTPISDLFLQVRVGGDVAMLQGIAKAVLEAEAKAPGRVLDHAFLDEHTRGFDAYRQALEKLAWEEVEAESGLSREALGKAAEIYASAERVIACWAMGLTQHRHGVANVQEVMNLLLLRGNIGRPGAGPCPVRGHSNVQGDRTMGIHEKPGAAFLDGLGREFGFEPPREPGLATVPALEAMHAGRVRVFMGLGGNFARATPDTAYAEVALRRCALSVHVSTKLNRSHLVTGQEALVLPCLGRTERDVQASGEQFVTVEDSMSVVHRSQGRLPPASSDLRSEPAIVAGVARAVLGPASPIDWEALVADYDRIRDHIERVVPGFERFNERVREPGGFVLPRDPCRRVFPTASGRAEFTVHPLVRRRLEPGEWLLTTIRSHDQFNTTIYGLDDRYRGIRGDRRVVFLHPEDVAEAGLAEGERVDLESVFEGERRRVEGFRVVPHDLPRGCAATYYPEGNPLVPVRSFALGSLTPTYKSIAVRILRRPA